MRTTCLMQGKARWGWLFALLLAWGSGALAAQLAANDTARQTTIADEPAQRVFPPHRVWTFAADGVTFSNRMPAARLNDVQRLGRCHYQVTIAPENVPINPSAWYGFSVRADEPCKARITFRYRHGEQRYWPKLSRDGVTWQLADKAAFTEGEDGVFTLRVALDSAPLRVFAQPPINPQDYREWESDLGKHIDIALSTIGHSVRGRPIRLLRFGNPEAESVLLVTGRQHPPETTGAQALMTFVDVLAADTELARAFRAETDILVVPLMNPDGVLAGNWRSNAHGIDINRDWGTFTEPETRAVRDLLAAQLQDGRQLLFAIDFHSTWHDVLYTVAESPARRQGGVLRRWINALLEQSAGRMQEKANDAKGTVFKNWIFRRYGAPSVTYEVGDRTPLAQTRATAGFAATALMRILRDPGAAEN